ncbi:hypothetical protein C1646_769896 [Rhizophagus diaphanus]|nr:hypothetical protein C1646_769896 [Rhizophagus diaphanus] [Rhizophagus sp. MUCL 43196]
MEMALKRERRWQHREETMATNREREAERDLDAREKQIRDREIMTRKLAEWGDDIEDDSGQEEYYKDRSRWWFHRQQFRACELTIVEADRNLTLATVGASQNNSVKLKLTLNLASKRRAALMALAEDEEFDDEEGKGKLVKELVATIPPDKGGLWYEPAEDLTKEMMKNGEFHAPNILSYTLVDSLNFLLIDGGFGLCMYILKYDETKGSDPNLQYWRVYVWKVIYHQWQKLTTLFIEGISPGVTDDWKKFSRDGDFNEHYISNEPWSFKRRRFWICGICCVLRSLRVLGGEGLGDDKKDNGVVLKEGANSKKLKPMKTQTQENILIDIRLQGQERWSYENKLALRTSPATEIKTEHGGKDDDTDLPTDLPLDQKDLIYREIAFFRERAAARERERQE